MRVGVVVDASCDIPTSVLERNQVTLIPVRSRIAKQDYLDVRDQDESSAFFQQYSASKIAAGKAGSVANNDVVAMLKETLIYEFDQLLFIAPHIKLNDSLQTLRETLFDIQPQLERLRAQANIRTPLKLRVIESDSGYAGYGLVLYETLRQLNEKARSADQIKKPVNDFKSRVRTLICPGIESFNHQMLAEAPFNLPWITQQKFKLTQTVPILELNSQGMHSKKQLKKGQATQSFFQEIYDELTNTQLSNHLVNVSYAGKLSKLRVLPVFKALHDHVTSKGGRLVYSVMSPTSAITLGSGAISIAFAGDRKQ